MAQVVTSENLVEFVNTGKVAEFKEPSKEEPKTETKPEAKEAMAKAETKSDVSRETDDKEDETGLKKSDREFNEAVQKRINEKHRQAREAEEFGRKVYLERREAEKRADALEKELNELKAQVRPPKAEAKEEPKAEDFKTPIEYAKALAKYEADKAVQAERERIAAERMEAEKEQLAKDVQGRIAEFKKEHADFDEVMREADESDIKVRQELLDYMIESESGAQLAYYLAKNPQEVERLNAMNARRGLAELGKITVTLNQPKEPKADAKVSAVVTPISQAPAPVKHLEGNGALVEKDPAKMSFKELREFERQRDAARRKH